MFINFENDEQTVHQLSSVSDHKHFE